MKRLKDFFDSTESGLNNTLLSQYVYSTAPEKKEKILYFGTAENGDDWIKEKWRQGDIYSFGIQWNFDTDTDCIHIKGNNERQDRRLLLLI